MELFAKIANGWKPLTIFTESFFLDVWLGSELALVIFFLVTFYNGEFAYYFHNSLLVRVLSSQSWGPGFKTTGCLRVQLSLSSFRGQSNECQELLESRWLEVNCLLPVALQPWGSWTWSMKRHHKVLLKYKVEKLPEINCLFLL